MINPFTLPDSDPELYHQRELQRYQEEENRELLMQTSIETRHEVFKPKSILSQIKEIPSAEDLPALPAPEPQQSLPAIPSKKETIREFIQRKREILLVKKSIQNKKDRTKFLEKNIKEISDNHKDNVKFLDDRFGRVKKYQEKIEMDAKTKADEAKCLMEKKVSKQAQINDLTEKIEIKMSQCERKTDELRALEEYKDFVETVAPQNKDKINPSIFITEGKVSINLSKKKFLKSIKLLESENLLLIRKSQEDEQELEQLRAKNEAEQTRIKERAKEMDTDITRLGVERQQLNKKIRELRGNAEDGLTKNEWEKAQIHSELAIVYEFLGGDLTNDANDLAMLELIENELDRLTNKKNLINEEKLKNEENLRKRYWNNINIIIKQEKEEQKNKDAKARIESRRNKVIKTGRQAMKRSIIQKKPAKKAEIQEPQEVIDWREFLEEDITAKY